MKRPTANPLIQRLLTQGYMHKPIDLFANPSLKSAGSNYQHQKEESHQCKADYYP
jgi:hypothetical protein